MKLTIKSIFALATLFLAVTALQAQIGIGTEAPQGMLDLSNSNSAGFVFPKVALTADNVAAPVTNPQGGALEVGTVVFNTATTTTGANDVSPGIYAWNGSRWNPQYLRQDSALFEQSPLDLRTVTGDTSYNSGSSDWVDVPGLGAGSTFTAKYTGTYKVKASFNFGGGQVVTPSAGNIMMATMEGLFRFTFDGSSNLIYTHSYSLYNNPTYQEQFIHDSNFIQYVNLTAGQTYNFRLEVDVFVATHYVNGGNSGTGRGHVGISIPCAVEFTFIDE
ncbi:hypothetical protein C5O00_02940 [Pukyongia salina]|uniref:Uncharacterized protein n=1 Tax=Pukyongia salina TaxID=2094025 RepID=A0A2S0HU29_9FLAO|nr:hypothetical protein [Pukyongia salina]AVI50179.1 hypothetical protein C5O00_02940 [Pukyongia salina]